MAHLLTVASSSALLLLYSSIIIIIIGVDIILAVVILVFCCDVYSAADPDVLPPSGAGQRGEQAAAGDGYVYQYTIVVATIVLSIVVQILMCCTSVKLVQAESRLPQVMVWTRRLGVALSLWLPSLCWMLSGQESWQAR